MKDLLIFVDLNPFLCWYIAGLIGAVIMMCFMWNLVYYKPAFYKAIFFILGIAMAGYVILFSALLLSGVYLLSKLFGGRTKLYTPELDCEGKCEECPLELRNYCSSNKYTLGV